MNNIDPLRRLLVIEHIAAYLSMEENSKGIFGGDGSQIYRIAHGGTSTCCRERNLSSFLALEEQAIKDKCIPDIREPQALEKFKKENDHLLYLRE